MILRPPSPPLFPYTTLFRSVPLSIRTERRLDDALERARATWVRGTRAGLVLTLAQGPLPPAVTGAFGRDDVVGVGLDRKSTRLNSSHLGISYAVFCLKKKKH